MQTSASPRDPLYLSQSPLGMAILGVSNESVPDTRYVVGRVARELQSFHNT